MNKGMKKHVMKAAACFLAGTITVAGGSVSALAAGNGLVGLEGASAKTAEAPAQTAEETEETVEETEAAEDTQETVEETYTPGLEGTTVVAQVEDGVYINIRSNPDTESEVVGKMYNNNAATVLSDDGEWLYVQSGNCAGYVAKYLMTTGSAAEEVMDYVGTPVAQSNVEALMVRSEPSEDGEVVDMITAEDVVYLEEDLGGWAKVSTANGTGYVCADYVSYDTYMPQAESREEEAARIAAEEQAWIEYQAEQERLYLEALAQQQAEWERQNQEWIDYLESQGQYVEDTTTDSTWTDDTYTDGTVTDDTYTDDTWTDDTVTDDTWSDEVTGDDTWTDEVWTDESGADDSYVDPSAGTGVSSQRQQIVDYALQFVGNPYVWGGTSLTNGADCSGFTQSVLGDNGISVNRTAGAQSQGGTSVDLSNIQPGDLLFYEGSGDYGIGHVSMYIGDGQVVHASNSTDGIIVSDIGYRTPVSAKSYID